MEKPAILLLAHGTPETIEEIPAYLRNVTSGRPLPEEVVKEIQHRYSLIGRSPLTDITMQQARLIRELSGLPTYVGMRNWKPYTHGTVAEMVKDGITHAVAICLAPHNSQTSVGLYRRAVVGETGKAPFTLDFVPEWHDEPLLIEAFAERFRSGYDKACEGAGKKVPVIFTAHSVPARTSPTRRSKNSRHWRMEVLLPKPGTERRSVDRSDGRKCDRRLRVRRTQSRIPAAHRLRLRSRGNSVRHRYSFYAVRRYQRCDALSRGVVERFREVCVCRCFGRARQAASGQRS
jgi:hypothetical protein